MTKLIEVGRIYRPTNTDRRPNPVTSIWLNVDHVISIESATIGDFNHDGEFFTRLCAKVRTTDREFTVAETVTQVLARMAGAVPV
jgi:hypothetical protein